MATNNETNDHNDQVEQSSIRIADVDTAKSPTHVAGGWGGLHIAPEIEDNPSQQHHHLQVAPSEEVEAAEDETPGHHVRRRCGFLQSFHDKFPRTYHSLFSVFLPVFTIIPVAILCGYFLAELEAPNEKVANNEAMADFATNWVRVDLLSERAYILFDECLDTYNGNTTTSSSGGDMVNMADYKTHVTKCKTEMQELLNTTRDGLREYLIDDMEGTVTFDWITCKNNETSSRVEPVQRENFIASWLTSFYTLWGTYALRAEYEEGDGALHQAIADANGADICEINVAGGAIFWWTIMTTVGYGNTAPTTSGGRALVFTMGFITILIFTAIIGNAGYVMLVIADDFFKRVKLKKLISGGFAILFWLCMLVLWILAVAGIAMQRQKDRYGSDYETISLGDAFWFSYITATTVGLGDIHIQHDVVTIGDMFYIPLLFLASFVLLSNFLYKLSDVIGPLLHSGDSLGDVLSREKSSKQDGFEDETELPPQDSTKRSDIFDDSPQS